MQKHYWQKKLEQSKNSYIQRIFFLFLHFYKRTAASFEQFCKGSTTVDSRKREKRRHNILWPPPL